MPAHRLHPQAAAVLRGAEETRAVDQTAVRRGIAQGAEEIRLAAAEDPQPHFVHSPGAPEVGLFHVHFEDLSDPEAPELGVQEFDPRDLDGRFLRLLALGAPGEQEEAGEGQNERRCKLGWIHGSLL